MNDLESVVTVVKAAMQPTASPRTAADAVDALRELGEHTYGAGGSDAYAIYQRLLFELHYGPPSQDHWRAQYLASTVYELEDRRLAVAAPSGGLEEAVLGSDELRARLWAQQAELDPARHPMFQLLFEQDPSHSQVTAYLRQQWLILQFFWQQFVELADQLERSGAPIEQLIVLYSNVWDELGCGDPAASHVEQHRTRQSKLGMSVTHRQVPDFPETMDYINTRLRLMRSPDPSAALGAIFSQEATAQSYGAQHHAMLQKVGIPSRYSQVYADHATLDVTHAEEVIQLAESLMQNRSQQERFLAGHRAQMLVWLAHMDRVAALLQNEPSTGKGSPTLDADHREAFAIRLNPTIA
jgi:pyrroloquinoline quinone (PQQ) biosynthesis protein C